MNVKRRFEFDSDDDEAWQDECASQSTLAFSGESAESNAQKRQKEVLIKLINEKRIQDKQLESEVSSSNVTRVSAISSQSMVDRKHYLNLYIRKADQGQAPPVRQVPEQAKNPY